MGGVKLGVKFKFVFLIFMVFVDIGLKVISKSFLFFSGTFYFLGF